ncbi:MULTISPECIES: ABC transporter ATP-binding protein [Enterococcus]|uniref:Iron complex transport system ATP-binding protein n=1 Tax=Candidatus Enterococcus ferrettii TaxID=2815324 RepID=A0ABV0EWP8_9ENTE|nr:ABC transporter ATP-binding protein [Enterococcus sp. 665A]MBO1342250.1 ABC transporter ATP-binding protein [Enterococcus sp. 665A]
MELHVENLCCSYENQSVLSNLNLKAHHQQFVGIIGPNGSGKSTLLKAVYRALKPKSGEIRLDETPLRVMSYKESAQKMAAVGQENELPFDFRVEEIVQMGRYPAKRFFDNDTVEDYQLVAEALEQLGITHLAQRNFQHLSGGEKQRVLIARALAQNTDLLLLDEPTNHLDIHYQLEIFELLSRLPLTVVSAIHDLNIAAMYCDYLYVMESGEILTSGNPGDVLTKETLQQVFQVHAEIKIHPLLQRPTITYLPKNGRSPGQI